MNNRIVAKGITVIMTLVLSITCLNTNSFGEMASLCPPDLTIPKESCEHVDSYRTGAQREDSRFIFWSQHQFEYHCSTCGENFWRDEDQ